jgi:hypothetical protein
MAEDYAAFKARRQAELAADPTSKAQFTGTHAASKPETEYVAHGPMKAQQEPASKPDASGKRVLNLNTAVSDADEAERAQNASSRGGVKPLDMKAIAAADKELAGYDKKPKAEKEAIDTERLGMAQSGLREARNAPDIESIATRKPSVEQEAAPKPRGTSTRRAASKVQTSRAPVAPAAPVQSTPAPEKSAPAKETPSTVSGATQFSGMMAAHAQHGNLVNPEAPKPKLGKDITYFGAVGGPKAPEEGKRGGPAYNTQQAYKKHLAGGGDATSYWAERDAKSAAKKPRAEKPAGTAASPAPVAETPAEAPKAAEPKVELKAGPTKAASSTAVTPKASVSESSTKSPVPTASKPEAKTPNSGRRSAPVAPKVEKKSQDFSSLPESGPGGSMFSDTGMRRMGPENNPSPAAPSTARNSRQGVLFDTKGNPNLRATGSAPHPTEPAVTRAEPMAEGSHTSNVPSPVSAGRQFGGSGDVHHHHYYGNVNQGSGTQINGNVGGHVMTDNASIGGTGGGSGSGGGRGAGSGGTVNKQVITGNPSTLDKVAYAALNTKVNGSSINDKAHRYTGHQIHTEDSQGRPIGHASDKFVQQHPMNRGNMNKGQFSQARGSRQQVATP